MADYSIRLFGVDAQNNCKIHPEMLVDCNSVVVSGRVRKQLNYLNAVLEHKEIIPIAPVTQAFDRIEELLIKGDVGVFASGDPLFFGIARKLLERFGSQRVKIFPAIASVQYACAAFNVPWDDMRFISVHGRNGTIPIGKILSHHKIALLTDKICRPEVIAGHIVDFIGNEASERYQVYIAENIGMHDERFVKTSLAAAVDMRFGELCCMLLTRSCLQPDIQKFGLSERDIIHSRGLITKSEVRSAALHSLALCSNSIMWDIGAGSGSVSVEAARIEPGLLIYAIEKETEQHTNIIENIKKYDLFNIKLVKGQAPDVLRDLPAPHRIFIGGSGGNLTEIVDYCADILPEGGRIVISAVLEKTRTQGPLLLLDRGFEVVTKTISVSRNEFSGLDEYSFNPITLIVGQKRNLITSG